MRLQSRIGCIVGEEGAWVAGRVCDRVAVAGSSEEAARLLWEAVGWDVDILVVDRMFFEDIRDEVYRFRREKNFPMVVEGRF